MEREVNYFRTNAERMRYADFRKRQLFVASGAVEAGCKTIVGQRLKRSGMHWTVQGANAIIAPSLPRSQWPLENFLGIAAAA